MRFLTILAFTNSPTTALKILYKNQKTRSLIDLFLLFCDMIFHRINPVIMLVYKINRSHLGEISYTSPGDNRPDFSFTTNYTRLLGPFRND